MSFETFLLYVATWFVVALTPGPAVMCAMAQSARYGFPSSLAGVAGVQVGNFLFFVCVALGLGALLATATTAFAVLRVAGALYLFYLGVRVILASFRRKDAGESATMAPQRSSHGLFIQGLLIQLTNPKALLFVSALLPQFIDPRGSASWQLSVLVVATMVVDTVVLASYAHLAQRGKRLFGSSRLARWLERVFGAALILFGVRLLLSRKSG